MDTIPVTLQKRDVQGKKTKRLRAVGVTPVHLYGRGVESASLQGPTTEIIKVLARAGGTTPLSITVEGEKTPRLAFVRDVQWDPVKGHLLHVDFLQVAADRPVRSQVPVTATGEAEATRDPGATVMFHLHTVEVEALPMDMPHEFQVDLSMLDTPDKVIRVRDLKAPSGVTFITDPEEVIAAISIARVREEVEGAEVAETEEIGKAKEAEGGEEGAEGGKEEEKD